MKSQPLSRNGRAVLTAGPGTSVGSTETTTPGSKDIKNGRKKNKKYYMGWYVADSSIDRIVNPYCSMVRGYILPMDL